MGYRLNVLLIWIFFLQTFAQAQPMVTKEAKILLVMDLDARDFKTMELFKDQNSLKTLVIKYPGYGVYIGLLEGGYELYENHIRPEEDAVITIYTDQQLFAGNSSFPSEIYPVGEVFKMQGNEVRVVSNKKGELILKMK